VENQGDKTEISTEMLQCLTALEEQVTALRNSIENQGLVTASGVILRIREQLNAIDEKLNR